MLRLVYSNRTEELLAALAEVIAAGRAAGAHPLDPVELVVPNRNLEHYLRLGLADQLGIAANLRFRRLERFVAELAAEAAPGARLVDAEALAGGVLAVLHDAAPLAAPELRAVRSYLEAPDADGVALRRIQLASRLGRLFEEYAYSRPEMLAGWRRGEDGGGRGGGDVGGGRDGAAAGTPPPSELLAWQRSLWRRVAGPGGVLAAAPPAGGRWASLADLVDGSLPLVASERPLLVFGVSYVARAFSALFQRLAAARPLWLFALNPCQEFWEDVETPAELRRRLRRSSAATGGSRRTRPAAAGGASDDPFGLFTDTGNAPLRLWGRPGREHVMLLDELSDCDFEERFADPAPATGAASLLAAVQRDVLFRAETSDRLPADRAAATADGSLQVLACADLRREVEVVAEEIWDAVLAPPASGRPPVGFGDIAVIVNAAARERYLPHLEAAFAEHHGIPCSVTDLPLAAARPTAEAARLLLELPFGRRTRADLLRLLLHPAFAGGDPGERAAWPQLADELGIFHGDDAGEHAASYVGADLLSWGQGLRRLALGAFMTGEKAGETRLWEGESGEVLVADLPPGRLAASGRFALLARGLLADAARLRDEERPLAAWAAALRDLFSRYLAPPEGEEGDLERCLGALAALERHDVAGTPVSGREACELARAAIGALGGGRGAYLSEGVAVSTLLPMRAIPFRVVFLVGLGEGEFPAASRRDALDLRAGARLAGDVTPAERDRYLFLEALLSARERLVISYVARDERTGEALRPASVVQELLDVVGRAHLPEDALATLHREPPARRWLAASAAPSPGESVRAPAASGERLARSLHAAAAEPLALTAAADPLAALLDGVTPPARETVAAFLGVSAPPPARPPAATAAPPAVQIATLRELLECPLQASARHVTGLRREEDEEAAAVTDEAFRSAARDETVLLRDALAAASRRRSTAAEAYATLARRRELAGRGPLGVLGEIERAVHVALLTGWEELVDDLLRRGRGERLRVGRVREHEDVDAVLPAVPLVAPGVTDGTVLCVLHGRSELQLAGRTAAVVADPGTDKDGREEKVRERRHLVRALCDHLLLAASGAIVDRPRLAVILRHGRDAPRQVRWELLPVGSARARALLAALAADLLSGVHDYLLPCEAVLEVWSPGQGLLDAAAVAAAAAERMAPGSRRRCSSRYGPIGEPGRYAVPPVERVAAILATRWQPLLALAGDRRAEGPSREDEPS